MTTRTGLRRKLYLFAGLLSLALGVLGVAAELVEYDKKYENAFLSLLGAVVIVKTLDDGIQLMKATGGTLKIATLEGDIINAGGSMTGGSVAKKEFSLLGRERETEELAARLKAGSAALDGIQAEIDAQGECELTEDYVEAVTAFLEKRKPVFKGK